MHEDEGGDDVQTTAPVVTRPWFLGTETTREFTLVFLVYRKNNILNN